MTISDIEMQGGHPDAPEQAHSAEPWEFRDGHIQVVERGEPTIATPNGRGDIAAANARRIVACVNALAGVPDDKLAWFGRAIGFLPDLDAPIDMVLFCPVCHVQHIDDSQPFCQDDCECSRSFDKPVCTYTAWTNPPHCSHLCHACGWVWRPADVATNGVAEIKTRGQNDSSAARDNTIDRGPWQSVILHFKAPEEPSEDELRAEAEQGKIMGPAYQSIYDTVRRALSEFHEAAVAHGYDGTRHALDTLFALKKGPRSVGAVEPADDTRK